jgi:tetratricopeptide (TPR) repeat protein
MALNNIGTRYLAQGRYAEALDYLNKSLAVIQEMGEAGDRRSLAYKYQNIGLVYRRQGHLDQALAYSRKSLDIYLRIDDKFGIANLQNNIGVIYKSQGQYEEGLEWFRKALPRLKRSRLRPAWRDA